MTSQSWSFCNAKIPSQSWLLTLRTMIVFVIVFLGVCVTDAAQKSRDFYRILGLPKSATTEQIKKKYRELSRKYHPDSNPDLDPNIFIDIRDAHEVLAKQDTRDIYDRYGEAGLSNDGGGGGGHGGFQQGGSFFTQNGQTFFFTGGGHPFESFFEGGDPFGGGGHRQQRETHRDLYTNENSDVLKVNTHNWDAAVTNREFVVMVNFYNPGCSHCVEFEKSYENLAKSFKDVMQVVAVHCRENQRLCSQNDVQRLPTLLLFGVGGEQAEGPAKYTGDLTEIAVKKWLNNNVPIGGTILTLNNFESWITSNANIPKVVFFAEKTIVPLMIRAVFHEFKSRVAMGCVLLGSSSGQALKREKFKNWAEGGEPALPLLLHLTDIDKLTGERISLRSQSKTVLSLVMSRIVTQKRSHYGAYSTEKAFKELTKRRYDSGECAAQDGDICVLLLHSGPLPATSNLLKAGEDVAAKFFKDPVKMFWVDATKQKDFAAAFGFTPEFEACKMMNAAAAAANADQCPDTRFNDCHSVIGFRPKRRKFKKLETDPIPSCAHEDLVKQLDAFVDSILNGGAPLTEKVEAGMKFI